MKKTILTLIALSLCTLAMAQWGDEEMSDEPTLRERIFTGGGFGLSFSSYYDFVSVSPLIGYKVTPKLAAVVVAKSATKGGCLSAGIATAIGFVPSNRSIENIGDPWRSLPIQTMAGYS